MWVKSHYVISWGKIIAIWKMHLMWKKCNFFHSGKLNYYCIIIICDIEKIPLYEYRRHSCQINQREMYLPVGQVTVWVSRIVLFA